MTCVQKQWRGAGALLGAALFALTSLSFAQKPAPAKGTLRSVQSFDAIADPQERSRALFIEAGRVIQSPRCLNCHPSGDRPTQGQGMSVRLHMPPVTRGSDGKGAPAMRCTSCHQAKNNVSSGVPGHPDWHLAPRNLSMTLRHLSS